MSDDSTILAKLKKYEAGGYYLRPIEDIYALINHIAILEEAVDYLREEVRDKEAWEGRYNALLEECEASRPPEIDDDGHDLPQGSIAIDTDGLPWGRTLWGWSILRPDFHSRTKLLAPENGPYTIVYTPKENANE
nr:MAG TPA: hypothetical protein [Caudoviricetes sp.]